MPAQFAGANGKRRVKKDANIEDYRQVLEPDLQLAQSKSLLLKGVPVLLSPFSAWATTTSRIDWWKAYNGLKHDRLKDARNVTLKHCIDALCALHQAMLKVVEIRRLVFRFGWADTGGYNPSIAIKDLENPKITMGYVAYTELFATFLHPAHFATVDDIRPVMFRNKERLESHL